jgi:hypothetical protein
MAERQPISDQDQWLQRKHCVDPQDRLNKVQRGEFVMRLKSSLVLAAATTFTFFAGIQSADAQHRWHWRFPKFYAPPVPDEYDDPYYRDDVNYGYSNDSEDYADPYYVPRRKHRYVVREAPPWWTQDQPKKKRRVNQARTLEPTYKPKAKRKVTTVATPVPKLAPSAVKRKTAAVAIAPEIKTVAKPAQPKLETASLTPTAKPKTVAAPSKTIGCTAGAAVVTGYGFANVTPKTCTGNVYAYSAVRDGKPYIIKLTSAQGEITEVTKQ